HSISIDFFGCVGDCTPSETYRASTKYIFRYTLTMPDGSQHEFRQMQFNAGALKDEDFQYMKDIQRQLDEGRKWRSINGSQMELDHSNPAMAIVSLPGGQRLYFPWQWQANIIDSGSGGTMPAYRAEFGQSQASYMQDRNGNRVTFDDDGSSTFTAT